MQANSTLPPLLALIDASADNFTEVPDVLLDRQSEFELSAQDICVITHVMRLARFSSPIYVRTLAKRMGVSPRTVQRALSTLEQRGYIVRIFNRREDDGGTTASTYDLGPLLERSVKQPRVPRIDVRSLSLLERAIVYYGPACAQCGSEDNPTADHIIPRSKGGKDSMDNIQILCMKHNSHKGSKTVDYRTPSA